jgi:hypothetical protein
VTAVSAFNVKQILKCVMQLLTFRLDNCYICAVCVANVTTVQIPDAGKSLHHCIILNDFLVIKFLGYIIILRHI